MLGPFPVGRTEVPEEAHDDVLEPGLLERSEKRARIALAEERSRVRDAETVRRRVLEPDEVVEVRAVGDRHDRAARVTLAHLVGDRVGDGDDRIRGACD